MIVKCFGCTTIHNKALYKCIIHSVWTEGSGYHIKDMYNKTQPRGEDGVWLRYFGLFTVV